MKNYVCLIFTALLCCLLSFQSVVFGAEMNKVLIGPQPNTTDQPNSSFDNQQNLHIHMSDPTFRTYRIIVPHRHLDGTVSPDLSLTLNKFSEHLAKLLEQSLFFQSKKLPVYEPPHFIWPEKGMSLVSWMAQRDGKATQEDRIADLVLFTRVTSSQGNKTNHRYEFLLADLQARMVTLQVTREFTQSSSHELLAWSYELADKILARYTGQSGLYSSRLVFIGRKAKGTSKQVFTCRLDGSDLQQITRHDSIHLSPSWSADGRKIFFTSYRSGDPDLYVYDLSTKKIKPISAHPGIDSGGQSDNNSSWVVLSGLGKHDTDIFMVPEDGGIRRLLIQGKGLDVDPTFSPDGRYLAYVSGRFGNPHIFLAELRRTVLGSLQVVQDMRLTWAGWYNGNPAFSRDSEKIAFAGYDKEIDRFDIFTMNRSGRNLERLTLKSGDNESPSWSPNDQLIVFHSNRKGRNSKGVPALYVMRRDGSSQIKIPVPLYSAQTPAWGPRVSHEKD
ncbi:MAG: hypothetical protein OXC40_06415 [Proteobacteria bacterium]|nr:hypothetical protein [Pseudomonadota bacterium]